MNRIKLTSSSANTDNRKNGDMNEIFENSRPFDSEILAGNQFDI